VAVGYVQSQGVALAFCVNLSTPIAFAASLLLTNGVQTKAPVGSNNDIHAP
jgi:hypothetical protein